MPSLPAAKVKMSSLTGGIAAGGGSGGPGTTGLSSHQFSRQLLRLAVGQVLRDAGFEAAHGMTTHVLVDVTERYLERLAEAVMSLVNHAQRTEPDLTDIQTALQSLSIRSARLQEYWDRVGFRVPVTTKKVDAQKEQRVTGSSGNAIIEAILGIKKSMESSSAAAATADKPSVDVKDHVSGFFRLEPGTFPLDVDKLLSKDYSPPNQEVPDDGAFLPSSLENDEDDGSLSNPYLKPRSFADAYYYQGDKNQYKGHGPPGLPPQKLFRDKILSKGRRLFEKAFQSCLEDGTKSYWETGDTLLNPTQIERLLSDRLQFSLAIPLVSNHGANFGLLEGFQANSLPELTGSKRAMPVYKDDKREQRREKKALEALRAASSSALDLDTIDPNNHGQTRKPEEEIMPMTLDSADFLSSSTQVLELSISEEPEPQVLEPMRLEITEPAPPVTPSTPKLKLKVKTSTTTDPPLSASINHPSTNSMHKTSATKQDLASIALEENYDEDQIKCICANPTVDYGLFMIACDACGIWFHGSCVAMGPDTLPPGGSWFCHVCKITKRASS